MLVEIRLRHSGHKVAAKVILATYAEFFCADGYVEFFNPATQQHETILTTADHNEFIYEGVTYAYLSVIPQQPTGA